MTRNRLAALAAMAVFGAAQASAVWVKIADFNGTVNTFGVTPSNPLTFEGALVPNPLVAPYVQALFSQNLNNFKLIASVSLNPDFSLQSGSWAIQHISNSAWKPVLGTVDSFSYLQSGNQASATVLLSSDGNLYDPDGNAAYTMNQFNINGYGPTGKFKIEGLFNDNGDGFGGSLYAQGAPVPEPATVALAAAGLAIAARRRRKA